MKYYDSVDTTNPNGTASATKMYLDRTLAHEFVHAAMAANITDFNSLPKWFKEGGSAEIVQGADNRGGTIVDLLQNPARLEATLNGTSDEGTDVYAGGFLAMRYMAKATVDAGKATSQAEVAKKLMQQLANTSGSSTDFDAAINSATGGTFINQSDFISKFMNVVNNTSGYNMTALTVSNYQNTSDGMVVTFAEGTVVDFLKDKFGINIQYYDYDPFNNVSTYDNDTGAITGSDAGSGVSKNAEDIVPETTDPKTWKLPTETSTTYSGLKVIWPDGYTTEIDTEGNSYTYAELRMTEKN